MGRRFFTMIELMVVIAILAILATMILPQVAKMREKFKAASCLNNLRQTGVAVMVYSDGNDGFVMPASFGDTDDGYVNHWINYMISRQQMPQELFQCPTMAEDQMFDPAGHDPETGNIYTKASYVMNIIRPGNWAGSNIVAEGASGWAVDKKSPIEFGRVVDPQRKVHITDGTGGLHRNHSGINEFGKSDHGQYNELPRGTSRYVGLHHSGRFNALFGDGHVERRSRTNHIEWAVNVAE